MVGIETDVLLAYIDKAGSAAAVLELVAIVWLAKDRARILDRLEEKSAKVEALAERVIVIATELRMFLFNERRT